ncbi:Shedu anti-phage system protein SduA domain-containing protein, partial [Parvimonas sp. M20]|uniref:Shedu anti-phage system protein SduA domain-containing protein n=1 Tax=Parvimonas sp. M20 TaxID=3110693 RepID=UPI002B492E08
DAEARAAYVEEHAIRKTGEEPVWQHFFEANPWIFGHGLNYVFLDKVGAKLEAITTGASHEDDGNRVDALMRTRAAISQYVLIEIKTPSAALVK